MSSNLRRRLDKLLKEEDAGTPCPECGYVDGEIPDEAWRDMEIEVVWNDLEDVSEEEPEEFCSTCGVQLSFTILWDDTPQAKRRWGEGA